MRTPHVLAVRRYAGEEPDAHGNTIPIHAAPRPWPVHGWAPGDNTEDTGRSREEMSAVTWTVYAPADPAAPGERDLVVLGGDDYEVDGRPLDYTHGPWRNPQAGIVVRLRRVEG